MSEDVLDAIAGAMRLTTYERTYLHRLTRSCGRPGDSTEDPPELRPGLVELLDILVLTPAAQSVTTPRSCGATGCSSRWTARADPTDKPLG